MRQRFAISLGAALLALGVSLPAHAAEKLKTVASFSILGDMVKTVGGDRVEVETLVGPNGDAHVFSPSPADAAKLAKADVFIVNGLGFEGWMERLEKSSDFKGETIVASKGVSPRKMADEDGDHDEAGHDDHDEHAKDEDHDEHDHDEHAKEEDHDEHDHDEHAKDEDHDGHDHDEHAKDEDHDGHDHDEHAKDEDHDEHDHDEHAKDEDHDEHGDDEHAGHHHHGGIDPHAWQDLANGEIYVANIRDGLIAADPEGKAVYEANAKKYLAALKAENKATKAAMAALPEARRRLITSHDAFGYFANAYGLTILAPEGVSTKSEPSAQDVAKIIRQIRREKIPAVFMENVTNDRLLEQISKESGAKIGGTLYSDALSGKDGPAPTYIDMFKHNVKTLSTGLSS